MLKALDRDAAEEEIELDARKVLKQHAKKEKTAAMVTGTVIAGILLIPVVIALILTLPGYSDLKTDAVLIASMLLVAGMTVAPFVIRQADLPGILKNHKGLLAMSWDTLWFYLMIFIFAIDYPDYTRDLFSSSAFVAIVWLVFITARYLKMNRWIKAGIIVVMIGLWTSISNKVGWIDIMNFDLHIAILVISLATGVVLCLIGILICAVKKIR